MKKYAYKIRLGIAGIVFAVALFAILGFYPIKIFDMQFTALLQRAFTMPSYAVVVLLLTVILFTIAFGRFYCSIICPFGILQEFAAFLLRHKKQNEKILNLPYKYFVCAVSFGVLLGGSAIIVRYIDPYTIFGSLVSLTKFGIIFAICILVLVFFKNRFFCSNICPVGAFLGKCSKHAVNKMNISEDRCVSCKMCEKNCPVGCIDVDNNKIDNEMCIKCLKCYSVCPMEAISYGKGKDVKFSLSRRKAIIQISLVTALAAGYAAGIRFAKEIAKNVKDVILPAGAKNANQFINKCLNCNLCINNCPGKILVKADDKYNAVHIDYKKGYCKFDCNKCSSICPSGAIKRISLEEKQNTRIAMAVINTEKCTKCGNCSKNCPKGAIIQQEEQLPVLDASKCIGCGKCKVICKKNAIEIFGIKEQTIV